MVSQAVEGCAVEGLISGKKELIRINVPMLKPIGRQPLIIRQSHATPLNGGNPKGVGSPAQKEIPCFFVTRRSLLWHCSRFRSWRFDLAFRGNWDLLGDYSTGLDVRRLVDY